MTRQPRDRTHWSRSAVVYQIYPRSFADSNGDGIGDLPGITAHLDHLKALGVDVVWLSPIYASPQDDNGYDISDYRAIAPEFGTMADFDAMLAAMHARGLKLMMDLVVNHSSDEHTWFQQARTSRDNPWHDHYIWREPRADGSPPNNWESVFSGSAWEWNEATGEYYLHMFSRKQPDLNWENPAVRLEVYALMRFWLDKGVDGLRMDVINMISKPWNADGSLPDAPVVRPGFIQPGFAMSCNGPRLLEFLREMRREVLDHYDLITVGETPMITAELGAALTDERDGALDMVFQFEHMDLDSVGGHALGKWAHRPLDLRELEATMARWQHALAEHGWNSLYWANHDQPRPVSRFGDDGRWRVESAKALATWLHGLQGTPYVYQGEELGMTNYPWTSIEECRDIEALNLWRDVVGQQGGDAAALLAAIARRGRDNARTPMQWSPGPQAGFTSGTPWLPVHPNHAWVNAQQCRTDPESIFHHYRRLIELRHREPLLVRGRFALLPPVHAEISAYTRQAGAQVLLVVCRFGGDGPTTWPWPQGLEATGAELLLGNWSTPQPAPVQPGVPLTLRPWEARLYRCRVQAG